MNTESKWLGAILIFFLIIQISMISFSSAGLFSDDDINASQLISFDGEYDTLFGEVITGIGDYNQDGYGDFIVGGRRAGLWRGKAWVYYGGPNGPIGPESAFTILGEPNRLGNGICMGHTAANLGDLNGDGVDDFAVAGPGSYGGWDVGKVYIYYGNPSGTPTSAFDANESLVSPIKYDWFGNSVANAGDFNGDGMTDLIVGAPGTNWQGLENVTFESGKSYIFLGSTNGYAAAPDITLNDDLNYSLFGNFVNGRGDINNDGYDDVAVAAIQSNNFSGRVHIFMGSDDPQNQLKADHILSSDTPDSKFGEYVGIIKDINNDGYDEIVIRTLNQKEDPVTEEVLIYFGRASISDIKEPDIVIKSSDPGNNFGKVITSLGDINQDSYNDIAIGIPSASLHSPGMVYIYYGGKNFDTTPDRKYIGEEDGDQFGYSIDSGDIDGDGKLDILITSLFHDNIGRAYVDLSTRPVEKDYTPLYYSLAGIAIMITLLILTRKRLIRFFRRSSST